MIGAIAGDIIGSVYEFHNIKTTKFKLFSPDCFFTDDSVLTIALADSILSGVPYVHNLKRFTRDYPNRGYGGSFANWAASDSDQPYNSFGNGAAMRISPVGFAFATLEEVLDKAREYTAVTHNHPEGIKGALATASAIFMARKKVSKSEIKNYITSQFGYDLSLTLDEIRPTYFFNETCQQTVPQAFTAFLESTDFEDAIRKAISLGGDSDTLACITGGIAQAYYGIPSDIEEKVHQILDVRLSRICQYFKEKYPD